jgi:DNA helicase IV
MENERVFENERLAQTQEVARSQLASLRRSTTGSKDEILSAKRNLREETSHSVSNLYLPDNFEALIDLSQYATQVSERISSYEADQKRIRQLEALLKSPYFARLDFKYDDENEFESLYIGRSSLFQGKKLLIYDWRSPIASMFYQFNLGNASYEAPGGKITGTISLKRQYEIKNGELAYYFDTNIHVLDEFLKQLLSQNASPQMRSIVETIQREQDTVIRDISSDLMMVQGVAGSGKTSIALHRVAYLLYNNAAQGLTSNNIIIISPHSLFEQYIANVLPELGENNITSLLFDEIIEIILPKSNRQTRDQFLEALITSKNTNLTTIMKKSLAYKTSRSFTQILNQLVLPKKLTDIQAAYRSIFSDQNDFSPGAPDCPAEIRQFTAENLSSSRLQYDDALVLTYLYLKANGNDTYKHVKQVVIDEVQDYYALHFEILRCLFPQARFTLLGDVQQTIEKQEDTSFYQEIAAVFPRKTSLLVTLNKSFRCATEIMRFSSQFVAAEIETFSRHSSPPAIHMGRAADDLEPLERELAACRANAYQSVGIICKSAKDSLDLYGKISKTTQVTLVKSELKTNLTGIFILPVYLSKGLEFDAILLWEVDDEHYHTEDDKKLLFIACTRALHRLSLFYNGTISPLLVAASPV